MTSAEQVPRVRPYHHGNLRQALLESAVDLVRTGGPGALTLRETCRRAGVTANAAYRHFTGLPALQDAVAEFGMAELARSMRSELAARLRSGTALEPSDPRGEACEQFKAVGRGYVRYALAQPGLFAATFMPSQIDGRFLKKVSAASPDAADPATLLREALLALVAVGLMPLTDLPAAATTAWSGVHGLSSLLRGPFAVPDPAQRDSMIESTLDHLLRAVVNSGA